MVDASRGYKKELIKALSMYKNSFKHKLRNLKSKDPKEYWKILNEYKKPEVRISNAALYDHFKSLSSNNGGQDQDTGIDFLHLSNQGESQILLDKTITQEEIIHAIDNLKNNKSAGPDKILNEYIKSTKGLLLPLYVKLFNRVLNEGKVPLSWLTGWIIPLYKNKGDPSDPRNYRGITLLSCLGKVFTALLNVRLSEFSDTYKILLENQAGFRKFYSTMDHVFLLKMIIDMFVSKSKKLYCLFVDYQTAFDSISRISLWLKLLEAGIKGKLFNVIYNMYQGIKSCVFSEGRESDYFISCKGVRQGENLSPFLFAIYVNDLQNFCLERNVNTLEFPDEFALLNYLKLMVIMYADDTVLMSNTAQGLQKAIDVLSTYCDKWELIVNTSKTEVVVFAKRSTKKILFLNIKM